ncbi:GntR family transcriptional regulator [Oenococcus alcoholitolerans]|uniref:GntR family transcriptional regulator n=1 Tax=Oenococcus alcoholitolerans TaxID=931074 RepID=UPI003F6FE7CE
MSKYIEIANKIKKDILEGKYLAGQALPDQNELSNRFKVSRMTVQKALNILRAENLVYSQRGSGTFVAKNINLTLKNDQSVEQYVGTTNLLGKDHQILSKIIKFTIRYPQENEQSQLLISEDDLVYDIIRLRVVDKKPYALEYTKMPVKVIPGINEKILQKSIYNYIEKELKLTVGSAFRTIGADKPNQADMKYLKLSTEDPVLEVTQTVFLNNNTPFEYSTTRHPYNFGRISVFVKSNK